MGYGPDREDPYREFASNTQQGRFIKKINKRAAQYIADTILHQQVHRTTPMPPRYSRHYYDLHKLAGSPFREAALRDLELLQDVVSFKRRFYPSAWASYETARPGSLKLVPGAQHLKALQKDYSDMTMMIFGEAPAFNLIVDSLRQLEDQINRSAHDFLKRLKS